MFLNIFFFKKNWDEEPYNLLSYLNNIIRRTIQTNMFITYCKNNYILNFDLNDELIHDSDNKHFQRFSCKIFSELFKILINFFIRYCLEP